MSEILNFPLVVFACSLLAMALSIQTGAFLARHVWPVREDDRSDLSLIVNASLTLLALIIGFSFSMAVSRYDQRKNYEEEEANAIGTEYVRAALLRSPYAGEVRSSLNRYLTQRLLFYTIRDPRRLQEIDVETARLQTEMWSTIQTAATDSPSALMALVVSGMNDVLNGQGYTQASWWNRIPVSGWSLMVILALSCTLLVGYSARRSGVLLFTALPFVISIAFFLIADIDSPRRGVIRVMPQNLISLSESLHAR